MADKTVRALRDWSNRIARPVDEYNPDNPGHAYSTEQLEARRGFDAYLLAGRPVFTDLGHAQALELADGAPIFAYVHVLHTMTPDQYASSAWPFVQAQGELLDGTALLNVEGEPSVRWYNASTGEARSYHTDPAKVDPAAWAELIVEWAVHRYPVAGLFLDYLAEAPWTYPQDPPVELEDGGLTWRAWQVRAVYELRRRAPNLVLMANGLWAVTESGWTRGGLVDSVFLEKLGTVWWGLPQGLERLRSHRQPSVAYPWPGRLSHLEGWRGRHVLDARPGPRTGQWHTSRTAWSAAAATGWAWCVTLED